MNYTNTQELPDKNTSPAPTDTHKLSEDQDDSEFTTNNTSIDDEVQKNKNIENRKDSNTESNQEIKVDKMPGANAENEQQLAELIASISSGSTSIGSSTGSSGLFKYHLISILIIVRE